MKLELARRIFKKSSNVKFHENPPSWSRACEQTDGETDMTKIAAFRETSLKSVSACKQGKAIPV